MLARLVLGVAKNLPESLPRADLDTPRHAHFITSLVQLVDLFALRFMDMYVAHRASA